LVDYQPPPTLEAGLEAKAPLAVVYPISHMRPAYLDRMRAVLNKRNLESTEFTLSFDRILIVLHRKDRSTKQAGTLIYSCLQYTPIISPAELTGSARMPRHWIHEGTGMKKGAAFEIESAWEWHGKPAEIPGLEVVATGTTKNTGGVEAPTPTVYPGPKTISS